MKKLLLLVTVSILVLSACNVIGNKKTEIKLEKEEKESTYVPNEEERTDSINSKGDDCLTVCESTNNPNNEDLFFRGGVEDETHCMYDENEDIEDEGYSLDSKGENIESTYNEGQSDHTHDFIIVERKETMSHTDGYIKYECSCGEQYIETISCTGEEPHELGQMEIEDVYTTTVTTPAGNKIRTIWIYRCPVCGYEEEFFAEDE